MTFTAFPPLYGTLSPAIQALARFGLDYQTGITGADVTLANPPVDGPVWVFKNGVKLSAATGYTINGQSMTLTTALISSDELECYYWYRQAV